jgi:WD40 repeat protein
MKDLDLQLVNTFTFPDRSYMTCNDCNLYEKTIRRLTISPDRQFLYGYRSGSYDDAFRPVGMELEICVSCLIEVQTGNVLWEEEISHNDLPCAFSPDSQFLAFDKEGTICIAHRQDFHKGRKQKDTSINSHWTGLTFEICSPDSTRLSSNYLSKFTSVTFSPDGLRVAAGCDNLTLTSSPDGLRVANGCDNKTIYIWNLTTDEQKAILTGHSKSITSVAFSPDGLTLASGSQDNTIHLWDLANYEQKTILTGHSESITSVAFSPDGLTLASRSQENTIHLWDLANYEQKTILTGHSKSITSVAFSPDGLILASGSRCDISFWNLESYQLLHTIKSPGIVSQDGKTFVIQADGNEKIEVWSWKFIPIQSN